MRRTKQEEAPEQHLACVHVYFHDEVTEGGILCTA